MQIVRYAKNPVITPDPTKWYEKECTYNPTAIVHRGKVHLFYRAEGKYGDSVSYLCHAVSSDGLNFRKDPVPLIKPTRPEEKRGCEDPRITKIDGIFYMTYTAYDGRHIDLSLATSKDLVRWRKHGVILKNKKAGLILPEKIHGKYLMLLFEGECTKGKNILIARSRDLKRWKVDKKPLLRPRKGMFDSYLVEPGPLPIVLKDRLLLIYNSADKQLVYRPSYLMLDRKDPDRVLYRHDKPLLEPKEQFELYGKVNNVIFAEGLVKFKGKHILYYGGADKCVGAAVIRGVRDE